MTCYFFLSQEITWHIILINPERQGHAFSAQQHVYFIYLCELSLLEKALILDWLREGASGEEMYSLQSSN